jgi:hypothetical protein
MKTPSFKKILDHPDRDEIISKLVIGISPKDVNEWLSAKYTNINETKFVISENSIKAFKDNYLDLYTYIREDIGNTKIAKTTSTEEQLELAVKNNARYKSAMLDLASKEIDVRQMVARLCVAIETRVSQVFDHIQEAYEDDSKDINTKIDRLLIDYTEALGSVLEKYYKFTEAPASQQIIQNNITVNMENPYVIAMRDATKEVLSQLDLEASMYFMELYQEKINKLKQPNDEKYMDTDTKVAEAKLLSETITQKLNG